MKTANEIKAIIEGIAKTAYSGKYAEWEIKEWCIDMTTYREDEDGYWSVSFAVIETLPNMSTLAHLDTIISNAGGKQPFLAATDHWELRIHFIVR